MICKIKSKCQIQVYNKNTKKKSTKLRKGRLMTMMNMASKKYHSEKKNDIIVK